MCAVMASKTVEGLFLVLVLTGLSSLPLTACQGTCVREDPDNRTFVLNPGDYDPDKLTPTLCQDKCSAFSHLYAGLTAGRFCLCGNRTISATRLRPNEECQQRCSGKSSHLCGGRGGLFSVYPSTARLQNLRVASSPARGVFTTNTAVTLTVSGEAFGQVKYLMGFGDAEGLMEKTDLGPTVRFFPLPGVYTVRVRDTANVRNEDVTAVRVHAPVASVTVKCDPAFPTNQEGQCLVSVGHGSSLSLAVSTVPPDLPTLIFSSIADPAVKYVGPEVPENKRTGLAEWTSAGTFLATSFVVPRTGRVVAWEFHVQAVDDFKIQILWPCEDRCLVNGKCQPGCSQAKLPYTRQCLTHDFCFSKMQCEDAACPPHPTNTSVNTAVSAYVVKAEVLMTPRKRGYHYSPQTAPLNVSAGDVFALVKQTVNGTVLMAECPPGHFNVFTPRFARVGEVIDFRTSTAAARKCVTLRAIVTEASQVVVPLTFFTAQNYALLFNVSNRQIATPDVISTVNVTVAEQVNVAIIQGPTLLITGRPSFFSLANHTGSHGASYTWDKGDGTAAFKSSSWTNQTLVYNGNGIYSLNVTISNAVSSKSNSTLLHVQDELTDLIINTTATTAALYEPHRFLMHLASGSNFTCLWSFNGSIPDTTTNDLTTPSKTHNIRHVTFTTLGNKTVTVTCANNVSRVTTSLTLQVQERIKGLRMRQLGQDFEENVILRWKVDAGSDIKWIVFFDGKSRRENTTANSSGYEWESEDCGRFPIGVYRLYITGSNALNSMTVQLNYEVTVRVAGLAAWANSSTVYTMHNVTVTMDRGKDVTITLDFQDCQVSSRQTHGSWVPSRPGVVFQHSFLYGDEAHVKVSASNAAGTKTVTVKVDLLNLIGNIQMMVPRFVLFPYPVVNVSFDISTNCSEFVPLFSKTRVTVKHFMYPAMTYQLSLGQTYSTQYSLEGEFNITAFIFNHVINKTLEETVTIIDMLGNASISTSFRKAPLGQLTHVTYSLFRGPKAPYCNLTWDFGNNVTKVTDRQGEGRDGEDSNSVTYTSVGTYTIRVTARTPLQTQTTSHTIEVIEPVLNSSFHFHFNKRDLVWELRQIVTVTITLRRISLASAKISINWGDGSVHEDLTFKYMHFRNVYERVCQHFYRTDGDKAFQLRVHNEASSVNISRQLGVYQKIRALELTVCHTPDLPLQALCQPGKDPRRNDFYTDQKISFILRTKNDAFATNYSVRMSSSSSQKVTPVALHSSRWDQTFQAGTWNLEFRAGNPKGTVSTRFTVNIRETIRGFHVEHKTPEMEQKRPEIAQTFRIQFDSRGPDTCLAIDFGDGSRAYYADQKEHCWNLITYSEKLSGNLSSHFSVQHVYAKEMSYTFTATARDRHVSMVKHITVDISTLKCQPPKVEIEQSCLDFRKPCRVRRNRYIYLQARPVISCSTMDNAKTWTIQTVDKASGKVSGTIDLNALHLETSLSQLTLKPNTLAIGLYKTTFSMTMLTGSPGVTFMATAVSYMQVVGSDLVGLMIAYGTTEVLQGTAIGYLTLEPLKYSYDPDVKNAEPQQSGISISQWACEHISGGGSNQCGDIRASGRTGRNGTLHCPLPPAMRQALQGQTYNISVQMEKDSRCAHASVLMTFTSENAPQVVIKCTGGSLCLQQSQGYLVGDSARLGLQAQCQNCGPQESLQHKWDIFVRDYRFPAGWKPLLAVELRHYNTLGQTLEELTIAPLLFRAYGDKKLLLVNCTITRPSGEIGWAATLIKVNEPPKNGQCSVEPKVMTRTIKKTFRIKCHNWTDDSGVEEFRFFSYFDEQRSRVQITSSRTAGEGKVDLEVSLPLGAHWLCYNNTITAVIIDDFNTYRETAIETVNVLPMGLEEVLQQTEMVEKRLQKLYQEGVPVYIMESATGLADMLNSYRFQTENANMADKFATGFGDFYVRLDESNLTGTSTPCMIKQPGTPTSTVSPQHTTWSSSENDTNKEALEKYERERNDRAQQRTNVLSNITRLPNDTILGRNQILSGICELIIHADEITTDAQSIIVEVLERFTSKLDNDEPVTPQEWQLHLGYLLEAAASLLDAAGTAGLRGTLSDLGKAQESDPFLDYSTNVEVEDDVCLDLLGLVKSRARTIEEVRDMQIKVANCVRQRDFAQSLSSRVSMVMQRLWKSYARHAVHGEHRQFNSGHARAKMTKASAGRLFGDRQTLNHSEAEVQLPRNITGVFPNDTVKENETLLLQVVENTNSPHRYTAGAKFVPTNTRFVSLRVLREKGDALQTPAHNPSAVLSNPILVRIPRVLDPSTSTLHRVEHIITSWNQFQIHRTQIQAPGSSFHMRLCPEAAGVQYAVVISLGQVPNPQKGHCQKAALLPPNANDSLPLECVYVSMNNAEVRNYIGYVYVGVRQLNASKDERNLTIQHCSDVPDWTNGSESASGQYRFQMFTSACYSISEGNKDWSTSNCLVHPTTTERWTVCQCSRLADTFAGGWMVPPNTIDWNFVFSHLAFHLNPTLYSTQIVILVLFIFAILWSRRKDRKDIEKLGLAPLADNDPTDRYFYEIFVHTSIRANAGTDSQVFFTVCGEEEETEVRHLSDGKRRILQRGSTDGFLMATPRGLGDLIFLRVWHDNSGTGDGASWYLNYLVVRDVQTRQCWFFVANTWLAVEEGDGQVERLIPVATEKRMTAASAMLAERSRHSLADEHLWFSVLARPPQSPFTRVQRVSCCLCLLYVTMLANAVFYKTEKGGDEGAGRFSVGPLSISLEEIYTGVMSNLIVFPVNFLIVALFRKSARRPQRTEPSHQPATSSSSSTTSLGPDAKESGGKSMDAENDGIFSLSGLQSQLGTADPDQDPSAEIPSRVSSCSSSRPSSMLADPLKEEKPLKKKVKWMLPWWCRLVAWSILWTVTITALFFVNFYGISFGDEKCRKWLISMAVSFAMSIFVTQPIKMILVLLFFSFLFRRGNMNDENQGEETVPKLEQDEIPLHEDRRPDSRGRRWLGACRPLNKRQLQKARQKRLGDLEKMAILREIVSYSFFVVILLVISYPQRSFNTYLYKHTMERVFIHNNETKVDFLQVNTRDDYWNWAQSGLINGIRAGPYYNDYPPFLLRGYVNDKVSRLLGYATMRQLRVRPSLCEVDKRVLTLALECNADYSVFKQEEGAFGEGWTPLRNNGSSGNASALQWYRYTDAADLDGHPYLGQLGILYSGGGYVVPLRGSKADLLRLFPQLQQQQWIDRYTRAVFVEFTLYNAQVNLFGIATILSEFHPTGGIVQSYHFEPAMLLPYKNATMVIFQVVCEVIYCGFILFFIVKLFLALLKEKLAFFKGFWNLVDLGIVSLSIAAILTFFYRLFEAYKLIKVVKDSKGESYVKFQYVSYWNELLTILLGWVVFLATVRYLRLLRFNKRVAFLAETLRQGCRSMLYFSIVFWIVFLAFAALFFLSFMTVDIRFSSFVRTMVACVLMMMGKVDIYTLTTALPYLAPLFVFLFELALAFILVNMFASILLDTFTKVREEASNRKNQHDLLRFLMSWYRRFTGLKREAPSSSAPVLPSAPLEEAEDEERSTEAEEEEEEKEEEDDQAVDHFQDRVDHLLLMLSRLHDQEDELKMPAGRMGRPPHSPQFDDVAVRDPSP